MRKPGKIVQCQDGKIGRTFNSEGITGDKIPVHIIAESMEKFMDGDMIKDNWERRLCSPANLKMIGYAD